MAKGKYDWMNISITDTTKAKLEELRQFERELTDKIITMVTKTKNVPADHEVIVSLKWGRAAYAIVPKGERSRGSKTDGSIAI